MRYKPGNILLNKYRIESVLGRGAFGEVYHVTHLRLKASRAIKMLRKDAPGIGSQDFQQARERFEFEAQLGARLDDPQVIKVYDFEEGNGILYLVMEYAPGGSLYDRLEEKGPLGVEKTVSLAMDLCRGLQALHENLKAVHRDLKPANILFDADGRAKIADLGLAQLPNDTSRRSLMGSLAGIHPGTPLYMSPEQESTRGHLLPSSDIFALGCVLFEALTGKAYKSEYGTRPSDHRPEVPSWLDEVILRTLAEIPVRTPKDDNDSTKRYRTADLVLQALKAGQAGVKKEVSVHKTLGQRLGSIPRWGWGVGIVTLLTIGFISLWIIGAGKNGPLPTQPPATEIAVVQESSPSTSKVNETNEPTESTEPTATKTPPATATQKAVNTSEPTLEIGSTMVSTVDGMTLIYIPAGEFLMGSMKTNTEAYSEEIPQHPVFLNAFWIDQTEVTNSMFERFVSETEYVTETKYRGWSYVYNFSKDDFEKIDGTDWQHPQGPSSTIKGLNNHPVVQVNWHDAQAYCDWAGKRLPTEAEWEKAARGVNGNRYPWGNQDATGELLNIADTNSDSLWAEEGINDGYEFTAPVGTYPEGESPYGGFDMAGNVWEWVADWFNKDYYQYSPNENPFGPTSGEYRVLRGGGWNLQSRLARTANRGWGYPEETANNVLGFRCAMDTEQP